MFLVSRQGLVKGVEIRKCISIYIGQMKYLFSMLSQRSTVFINTQALLLYDVDNYSTSQKKRKQIFSLIDIYIIRQTLSKEILTKLIALEACLRLQNLQSNKKVTRLHKVIIITYKMNIKSQETKLIAVVMLNAKSH